MDDGPGSWTPAFVSLGMAVIAGAEGVDTGALVGAVESLGKGAPMSVLLVTGVVTDPVGVEGEVWTGAAEPLLSTPDPTGVLEADPTGVEERPVWTGAAEPLLPDPGVVTGVVTGAEERPVWMGAADPLSPDATGVVTGNEAPGVLTRIGVV